MICELITTITVTLWVVFCAFLYAWHYIIEEVLDLPISGQSPCSAHATLKLLIQKFIQEAAELPKLRKFEDHPAIPDDTRNRTYEDLLSTAIINKVIQNSQEGAPSRSVSSRASSRRRGEKEYFFGERNLDSRRVHDDTSSLSSLDSDTMSFKIRGCIKEASSSGDETKDEDEVDTPHSKSSTDWQDNWRLQKRKYNGTTSPVPVPMLVPDPITEAKVLIGDREADDTTDLSDAASDYEEALEPATLNSVLVNSRTVIGGRSPLESLVFKQESISEDGSTDATDLVQEKEDIVRKFNGEDEEGDGDVEEDKIVGEAVVRNEEEFLQQKDAEDELISLDSNTEKDLEYTERYASLPRTIYKSPILSPRQSHIDTFDDLSIGHEHKTDNVDSGVTSDEDEKQRIFKGTYSEREKEKWNHAVPLSNNPYSKSNLERRLSSRSSNSSIGSSFDRDYYIREAAKSAGARKSNPSPSAAKPQEEDDEVKKPAEIEEKIQPKIEQIYKAVPAVIEDEPESSIEPSTPTRPNQLDISSDSDYSIERTYNIETGQVIRKPNSFRKYAMDASRSPEGIKYLPKDFDIDENHNKLQNEKRNFLRSLTTPDEEDASSLLDSSFEEVMPPRVNHFKLVEEIANETSDQYDNTPLSPPAEYKSLNDAIENKLLSSENTDILEQQICVKPIATMFKPPSDKNNEDSSKDNDDKTTTNLPKVDTQDSDRLETRDYFKPPNIEISRKSSSNSVDTQDIERVGIRDYYKPPNFEIPRKSSSNSVNEKRELKSPVALEKKVLETESSIRSMNGRDFFKDLKSTKNKDDEVFLRQKPVDSEQKQSFIDLKSTKNKDCEVLLRQKPIEQKQSFIESNSTTNLEDLLKQKLRNNEDKQSLIENQSTKFSVPKKEDEVSAANEARKFFNNMKSTEEVSLKQKPSNDDEVLFRRKQPVEIHPQTIDLNNSKKEDEILPANEARKFFNNMKSPDEVSLKQIPSNDNEVLLRRKQPVDEVSPQTFEDQFVLTSQPESPSHLSLNDDQIDYMNKNMGAFKEKIETVLPDQTEEFSLTYSEVSEPEAEINDLKEKKLVNNLLGTFSKSFPNLNKIHSTRNSSPSPTSEVSYRSASVDISEVEDDDDLPSVRRLSKIFNSNKNGKQDQVYSLTARSIPKEFRQELKKEPTTPTCDVITEVITSETPKEETVLPFPKAKSKIEFFEKLKK